MSGPIAGAILVSVLLIALVLVYLYRRPLPQVTGTLRLPGLTAPVEVLRDEWGVPHLYAQSLADLYCAHLIFNRPARPMGGDPSTVWQAAYVPAFPIQQIHFAPSWRQIIDLADWDNCRGVHVPGQSGHPASKHYDDLIEPWLRGEYHPLLWSRASVEQHTRAKLVLEPASTAAKPAGL